MTGRDPRLAALDGCGTGALVHVRQRPAREATYADWPDWLQPPVEAALRGSGINRPWVHQRQVADLAHAGQHCVIATGTASGKSLGYAMPILSDAVAASGAVGRGATALYLAPTKALAADQLAAMNSLAIPGVRAATYDGDTATDERRWVREHANIVLTNPDLLHHTLLPNHERWAPFLRSLRYVVIDECHSYKGIFGVHVAMLLRRLRRVAARYKADPTMILASATVTSPQTHASILTGASVSAVTEDGSPQAATTIALWDPGTVQEKGKRSAVAESADVMARLVGNGTQTLTFAKSRVGVEVVADMVRDRLTWEAPHLVDRIAAYRGGYLPEERRALEDRLRSGDLRALAATNALELGIDIHGLDAVVIAGWPGTIASWWQQAGRAGRRGQPALVIFVADNDPLDTYLVQHPQALLDRAPEAAALDVNNPYVLGPHLAAAAAELPLTESDSMWFGPTLTELADALVERGALRRRPRGWFWARPDRPADHMSLRGTGEAAVSLVENRTGRVLGTVDHARAGRAAHTGAVYLHQGQTYVVSELDLEAGTAHVTEGDPGWSTLPQSVSAFDILSPERVQHWGPIQLCHGVIEVREQVTSFLRRLPSGEVLGQHPLDLPEQRLRTRGVWWTLPEELAHSIVPPADLPGALHAAEHASIGMLPLLAQCDRWDIGGVSTALHPDTGMPTVVVYDGYPGGAGFAEQAYALAQSWLRATRDVIRDCTCQAGCPACIQSPKCGNGNEPLDKSGAVDVLDLLLAHADSAALAPSRA